MIQQAVDVLRSGGVIAYPTEFCFGLGCDPQNQAAVNRILDIKRRSVSQGLILAAANVDQIEQYAELSALANVDKITASWPGPNTWVLPAKANTPAYITGEHDSVAMRVSADPTIQNLCKAFGGAIVSTSANRHGVAAALTYSEVSTALGDEVDLIVMGEISQETDQQNASAIYDSATGARLR